MRHLADSLQVTTITLALSLYLLFFPFHLQFTLSFPSKFNFVLYSLRDLICRHKENKTPGSSAGELCKYVIRKVRFKCNKYGFRQFLCQPHAHCSEIYISSVFLDELAFSKMANFLRFIFI